MKWKLCSAVKKDAAERIAKTNKYRSDYYKHFTGREWMDARNYDLVLEYKPLHLISSAQR